MHLLTQDKFDNLKCIFLTNFQLFLTRVVQTRCANDTELALPPEQQGLMGDEQVALQDMNTAEFM